MKRAIITPAGLGPAALAELKQWLAVTGTRDDALLEALLRAALDLCEDFTGTMPLQATCETMLEASACWQTLATRPVQAIVSAEAVAQDGTRSALAAAAYEIELDADGGGRVRLTQALEQNRLAVRFVAGLAPGWGDLPESLRHGIIRIAAHQHRQRESAGGEAMPPAAVAALWRPWRRMRLA